MFYFFFFFKKQRIINFKKASWLKFCNIMLLFLLKIGSVGPADQQINLVSPNEDSIINLALFCSDKYHKETNRKILLNCIT